jgi:hypothetical protein
VTTAVSTGLLEAIAAGGHSLFDDESEDETGG